MKKQITMLLALLSTVLGMAQTPPPVQWEVALGGTNYDVPSTIQQTADGGYIVSGYSNSQDGDLAGSIHYGTNTAHKIWIVKLDGTGSIEWKRTYGIGANDYQSINTSIKQTANGDYIVVGTAEISGQFSNYLVMKIDGTGNVLWANNSLGGNAFDIGTSVWETADNNYIVAGYTAGSIAVQGGYDYYIVKVDALSGNMLWDKVIGGSGNEYSNAIQQAVDGNYLIGGTTTSNNGDVSGNHGGTDGWLVKLDATGTTILWQRAIGGSGDDWVYSFEETADGGYIIGGSTTSTNGDFINSVNNYNGGGDAFVMKLDSNRNVLWSKYFGGTGSDEVNEIKQTNDGGYIVAGVKTNTGSGMDSYTIKLDGNGNIEWEKTISGSDTDENYSAQKTSDNGYILLLSTNSTDGDFTGSHDPVGGIGNNEFWVVKLLGEENQSACITWSLANDQSVTSVSGNINGLPQIIQPPLQALDYNGGQRITKPHPGGGWGWTPSGVNSSEYIEFNASPVAGNDLTVTSVSFDYSDNLAPATDFHIVYFDVAYSLDNWGSSTTLATGVEYLGSATQNFSYMFTSPVNVNNGNNFSLRIFPYSPNGSMAGTPSFAIHSNVIICGETQPSEPVIDNACIVWDLLSDDSVSTVSGDVTGQSEILGAGSNTPFMSVFGYNANGQRLWSGTTGWVQGSFDIGRYIQFDVAPNPGNNLTVNTVSFDYSDTQTSTDFNIIAFKVGYSIDDWGTINFLNNGAVYTYLGTSVQTFTATLPSVTVPDGSTFSLRIFPYALQNGIASVPTMATHRNVMICGTTTPVSTTPEEQCLINYLTEGPCGGYTPDTMINDGCSVSMGSDPVLYVSGYDTTFGQTVTVDGWQAGTYDPTRYIAFNVKPLPNNTLTVTSVSFDYADLGATDNAVHGYIVFDVGSGSNWTTNFLGNIDYSTQSVQTFTYQIPVASQSAVIPDGQYFILKIYLWANVDEGAVPFFPTHKDVTICGITEPSLSIEQQILPKISMYPNPVTDDLYFQSDGIIEKVEIIDRTGKIVLKTAFYNTQGEIRMTGLSSGLYFARVTSGKNTEVMKIIKR